MLEQIWINWGQDTTVARFISHFHAKIRDYIWNHQEVLPGCLLVLRLKILADGTKSTGPGPATETTTNRGDKFVLVVIPDVHFMPRSTSETPCEPDANPSLR